MLQDSLKVPVGLICNAIGGSPTEAWVDRSTLEYKFPAILRNWTQNDFIQDWVRGRAALNVKKAVNKQQRHPYEPCYLSQSNDNSEVVLLHTGWEFSQAGTELWRTAEVPGTVHQDLIHHKLLPSPFYGMNEQKIQWVENEDWEYRTSFTVTMEQLGGMMPSSSLKVLIPMQMFISTVPYC